MKRGVLLGGGLTLIVGVGLALADGNECLLPRPGHPVIAALDVDRDGVISAEEIADATIALLTLDTNGDGDLSREELRPPPPEGPPSRQRGEGLMLRDADGDGVVTFEEFTARAAEAFTRIDANGDGQIEQSEAEAAGPPSGHRRPESRRRGGPRGGT